MELSKKAMEKILTTSSHYLGVEATPKPMNESCQHQLIGASPEIQMEVSNRKLLDVSGAKSEADERSDCWICRQSSFP